MQEELRRDVVERLQWQRRRVDGDINRKNLLEVTAGDFVLIASVQALGITPKLLAILTLLRRVVSGEPAPPACNVQQDIGTGQTKAVDMLQMRPCTDKTLEIRQEGKDFLEMS